MRLSRHPPDGARGIGTARRDAAEAAQRGAMTRLAQAGATLLPAYAEALRRGFQPSTYDGDAVAQAHLAAIERDAEGFLQLLDNRAGRGTVRLPDGREVPRLPGFTRFILDESGVFCGVIHARWQHGTAELPAHVLGHVGYLVAPWRQREGHATRALGLLLPDLAAEGLPHVDLTTDPENRASIRVIEANGGLLVERFRKHAAYGGAEGLRFRIWLASSPA
jgi:predicted acetyltransferase